MKQCKLCNRKSRIKICFYNRFTNELIIICDECKLGLIEQFKDFILK